MYVCLTVCLCRCVCVCKCVCKCLKRKSAVVGSCSCCCCCCWLPLLSLLLQLLLLCNLLWFSLFSVVFCLTYTYSYTQQTHTYEERQLLSDFLCFSSFSVSFLLLSRRFVLNFPIFCHAARAPLLYDLSAIFLCTLFKLNPDRTLQHPRHTERMKHPVSISHYLPHCVRIFVFIRPHRWFFSAYFVSLFDYFRFRVRVPGGKSKLLA